MKRTPILSVSLALALFASCSHDQKVMLQENQLLPQRNYGREGIDEENAKTVVPGTTQNEIIERFGTPLMIHVEGEPCKPWDSCSYRSSYFVYRAGRRSTCYVTFVEGKTDKPVVCERGRRRITLRAGDIDPRTGTIGH